MDIGKFQMHSFVAKPQRLKVVTSNRNTFQISSKSCPNVVLAHCEPKTTLGQLFKYHPKVAPTQFWVHSVCHILNFFNLKSKDLDNCIKVDFDTIVKVLVKELRVKFWCLNSKFRLNARQVNSHFQLQILRLCFIKRAGKFKKSSAEFSNGNLKRNKGLAKAFALIQNAFYFLTFCTPNHK